MRKTLLGAFGALLVGFALVWAQPPAVAWLVQKPAGGGGGCGTSLPDDCVPGIAWFYSSYRGINAAGIGGNAAIISDAAGANGVTITIQGSGLIDQTKFAAGCSGACTLWEAFYNQAGTGTFDNLFLGAGPPQSFTNWPTVVTTGGLNSLPAANYALSASQYLPRNSANVGPSAHYSECAIIKLADTSNLHIISSQAGIVTAFYQNFYVDTAGALVGTIQQDNAIYLQRQSAAGAVSTGTSHFVCMVWDGGTADTNIHLYVAAVDVGSVSSGAGSFTAPNSSSITWGLGAYQAGSFALVSLFMNGHIDEDFGYTTAITQQNITDLCNSIPGGTCQ